MGFNGVRFEFGQVNGDVGVNGHRAQYLAVSECETDRECVWPSPTICMETIAKETASNMTHAKCQLVTVSSEIYHKFQNIFDNFIIFSISQHFWGGVRGANGRIATKTANELGIASV